jgi:hypothetical protein
VVMPSVDSANANTEAVRAQRAQGGETMRAPAADRLRAHNDPKRERDTERKTQKRDRHNGKHRNRR